MKMVDYESGRNLRDIDIELTRCEVEKLAASLSRLLLRQDLRKVYLKDINDGMLEKELTFVLKDEVQKAGPLPTDQVGTPDEARSKPDRHHDVAFLEPSFSLRLVEP